MLAFPDHDLEDESSNSCSAAGKGGGDHPLFGGVVIFYLGCLLLFPALRHSWRLRFPEPVSHMLGLAQAGLADT